MTVEWERVVLTESKKGNGALDDLAEVTVRFTPALGLEDLEHLGVTLIAFCRIKERLNETPRRILCCRGVQIQAKGRKDLCSVAFESVHLFFRDLTGP